MQRIRSKDINEQTGSIKYIYKMYKIAVIPASIIIVITFCPENI